MWYAVEHGVHPALIILRRAKRRSRAVLWMPFAHDIVTILKELQVKSDGIVWTTAKAVVLRMVSPRVYNLLHDSLVYA